MASEVTQIVVPFPRRFSNLTRITAPSQAISMLDGATSVHVSYLWFPGRYHIWRRAAGLTLIMASEVTRVVAPFWPPAFIRV